MGKICQLWDRFGRVTLLLLAGAGLIMTWNTFAHNPDHTYDHGQSLQTIVANQDPLDLRLAHGKKMLRYQPVLYHALLGKANRLCQIVAHAEWHPFYFFRLAHIAFMIVVAALYGFSLAPRVWGENRRLIQWLFFCFFLLPNQYLSQVMVRSDHLLFLTANLLFYLWFRFDFAHRLAVSRWRQLAWSALIILMANTRQMAAPACAVFFIAGIVSLAPTFVKSGNRLSRLKIILLLLLTTEGAGWFYFRCYLETGYLFEQPPRGAYLRRWAKLAEGFDRRLFFLNFEFDEIFKRPNRDAEFHATQAWPARALDIKDRGGNFEDDNNSFLPRLYSDMWGDHWQYFSGRRPYDPENTWGHKIPLKRVVLILAAPFTILYFCIPLIVGMRTLLRFLKRAPLDAENAAALIFTLAMLTYLFWLYNQPNPGKNDTVKFCYLFAYSWFPFFPIAGFMQKHPRLEQILVPYTFVLFVVCIPLFVFIP